MERVDIEIIKRFEQLIKNSSKSIVLVPHTNPDGDAMGSVLGLWRVLQNAGFKVKIVSPTKYPEFYHWMDGHDQVIIYSHHPKQSARAFAESDLLICLDFNQLSRLGDMKPLVESFEGKKILVDHHPYPGNFTDLVISDITFSSTAELIFAVLKSTEFAQYIDRNAATSLFTGIMTDTGSFAFNVSNPNTFEVVAQLTRLGIDQQEIYSKVYDNYSADRMRLMGFCLSNRMNVYPEYHAASMYITREDQKAYHFVTGDNEGFVNMPLSIKGIIFSALFTEKEKYIKVSFRSKGDFAVNELCEKYFNGGGHRNAAGGEYFASLQEAMTQFENILPEFEDRIKQSVK
ncbi:MAG: bifunctional oligoribonuclease/PAP phosphatase NrnA [Bacteroidota bacterium]|nr:DHH family phosphoesterase [Odoribacter sp.]MDP3643576.1 bifunctional oligoribonuclease/PAP phosphatase NrnA [Bacteroidota bacterium]